MSFVIVAENVIDNAIDTSQKTLFNSSTTSPTFAHRLLSESLLKVAENNTLVRETERRGII